MLNSAKRQDLETEAMWSVKVSWSSIMTPRFLAVLDGTHFKSLHKHSFSPKGTHSLSKDSDRYSHREQREREKTTHTHTHTHTTHTHTHTHTHRHTHTQHTHTHTHTYL